jgi:hypothetical protein
MILDISTPTSTSEFLRASLIRIRPSNQQNFDGSPGIRADARNESKLGTLTQAHGG